MVALEAARWTADLPSVSKTVTSHPLWQNSSTTSLRPFREAQCRGVRPVIYGEAWEGGMFVRVECWCAVETKVSITGGGIGSVQHMHTRDLIHNRLTHCTPFTTSVPFHPPHPHTSSHPHTTSPHAQNLMRSSSVPSQPPSLSSSPPIHHLLPPSHHLSPPFSPGQVFLPMPPALEAVDTSPRCRCGWRTAVGTVPPRPHSPASPWGSSSLPWQRTGWHSPAQPAGRERRQRSLEV